MLNVIKLSTFKLLVQTYSIYVIESYLLSFELLQKSIFKCTPKCSSVRSFINITGETGDDHILY